MAAAIEGSAVASFSETNTTSAVVDLPDGANAGGEPVVGEVLEVHMFIDQNNTATATGWTETASQTSGPGTGRLFKREVTSGNQSETTATFTLGSSQGWHGFSWRISGLLNGIDSIEAAFVAWANTSAPNPPNLDPSWAANSTLWVCGQMNNNGNNTPSATGQPTGYTMEINGATGGGNGGGQSLAFRTDLDTTSEDPGAFTPGFGGLAQTAYTVAYEDGTGSAAPAVARRSFTLLGIGR